MYKNDCIVITIIQILIPSIIINNNVLNVKLKSASLFNNGIASGKCGFTTLREINLVFSMLCRLLYKFYSLSKIESLNYFQDKSYKNV